MQYIIGLFIIILILVLLGVSVSTIVAGIWWLVALLSALSELFFLLSFVLLLFTKRKPAAFLRLEKGKHAGLFAVYEMDQTEYKNLFPTDAILENVLYRKKEVEVQVLKVGKRKLIFDNVTLLVIGLGIPSFAFMTLVMTGMIH